MDRKGCMLLSLLFLGFPSRTLTLCTKAEITDETQAQLWLDDYNERASEVLSENNHLWFEYYTNITDPNYEKALDSDDIVSRFNQDASANASCYAWENFSDLTIKREFSKIAVTGNLDDADRRKLTGLVTTMEDLYFEGKVCGRPGDDDPDKCYEFQPDLEKIFAESRDWDELIWAWKGWRDATGKLMKQDYEDHVVLLNKEAKLQGYSDTSESWKSLYENENFENEISDLFEEVADLYKPLHTYVKNQLKKMYPDHKFPESGHIPAHILGNNWAQDWSSLVDEELIIPYPGRSKLDITDALVEQNFTAKQIYKSAEDFFMSLGFDALPESFWTESMIEQPSDDDREVDCYGSAWDFMNAKDFRISFCTEINHRDFIGVYRELGHIYYYIEYKDQPVAFRDGSSPAVPAAIGDLIVLSATSPEYLHSIGLMNSSKSEYEDTINFLMLRALEKTAFLPFSYLVDQWRWDVFSGKVQPENYNSAWWDLRCRFQGVSPPVERTEADFDPGAKYHIPSDSKYIRYFLSFIVMFQYQKALCDEAGYEGPLHECNLFNSKAAGDKLRQMLSLGSSKPFPETLMMLANTKKLSAAPLVEYFKPLIEWLEKKNEGMQQGWDDECPSSATTNTSYLITPIVFVLLWISS